MRNINIICTFAKEFKNNYKHQKLKQKRMKKVTYLLSFVLVLTLMSNSSCEPNPTSDEIQNQRQERTLKEAVSEVGMPAIVNFQEKKLMKLVYEKRDDNKLLNYAYAFSEVTGKFTFMGKCIGFPIPYSTQYTSPQKVDHNYTEGRVILPNADPNGLFSPASADGTWILLVNPKTGEPTPMYMEPKVTVVPFPLSINICTGGVAE